MKLMLKQISPLFQLIYYRILKYKIISKDNAEYLIDTGKLKIKNVDKVIEKY